VPLAAELAVEAVQGQFDELAGKLALGQPGSFAQASKSQTQLVVHAENVFLIAHGRTSVCVL
jgi:hypothetical protein